MAVDAPLALPIQFKRAIDGNGVPELSFYSYINNELAYRACERHLFTKYGKRTISGTFDKLMNLYFLVKRVIHLVKQDHNSLVHCLPYNTETLTAGIGFAEVYPALIKNWHNQTTLPENKAWPLESPLHELHGAQNLLAANHDDHLRDATWAAITIWQRMKHLKGEAFKVPEEWSRKLAEDEGWIYYPSFP